MRDLQNEFGISPAVGVILLLGITAALATIAGIVLLDIGDGLTQNAQAGVSVDETPDGVEVTWTTDSNAEEIIVQANGQRYRLNSVNDKLTLGLNKGSSVSVIGVVNGEESVISETTTESDTGDGTVKNYNPGSTETVSGTVSINPPIDGATVRAVKNDTIVSTTTTDSSGNYSINTPKNSRLEVVVEDFTYDSGNKTFYGSTVRDIGSDFSSAVNVDFTEPSSSVTINGNSILVGNESYNGMKTIGSIEQLQAINSDISSDYMLLNDIDASETSSWNSGNGFEPLGSFSNPFTGDLNGNGYTISNLTIDRKSADGVGLIDTSEDGKISNLTVTNSTIAGNNSVGVIAGDSTSTVENITVESSTITGEGTDVGGLMGYSASSSIEGSSVTGSVTGGGTTGGLIGYLNSDISITNSFTNTEVESTMNDSGGLIGYSNGSVTIEDSSVTGSVTGGETTGGLIGYLNGTSTISNSYATGTVESTSDDSGGLIGYAGSSSSAIMNSYATGNVTGDNNSGGLIGDSDNDTITNSYTTGNVTGTKSAGGLVGDPSNYTIENSYATGDITATEDSGGLVGYASESTITDSYATGSVNGDESAGGLIGYSSDNTIELSYAKGTVTGIDDAGGLIGYSNNDTVTNSYATGNVTGDSESGVVEGSTGGLIGYSDSNITNAYSTGSVTGANKGGLTGDSSGTITSSYWDTESSGIGTSPGSATGLTTSEMQGSSASSNMSGFDFTNTWTTNSADYPTLQG